MKGNVCGLDVHKDNVFVCILKENGEKILQRVGILTPELDALRDMLVSHGVGEVCMESTSIYWMPVWRVLESDFHLWLVNPLAIKQLPGRKSDVKDAEWIATCLKKDLVRGSYVPEKVIQQLRQYNRRVFDINKETVFLHNKLDAALQRCNIRLSNYVSNVDTKAYREVVEDLSKGVTDPGTLLGHIHKRTKNKWGEDVLRSALTGVVSEVDTELIGMYREELELLRTQKAKCLSRMREICQKHFPKQMKDLQTMPGVREQSATQIIAEIGVDMRTFLTAAMLVGWAGFKPRNDESNKKLKSRSITHGNKYLKKLMVECAWGATRTQGCFYSQFSYHQTQVRKKNAMKVRVAVARKQLVGIWHILSEGCTYKEYSEKKEEGES